ncbi:hypothetical protein [Agromyces sp. NPDC058064]|uniref:hypothetical protein n=1 Tax=Agromyces sp. NPDC058064 TaxID=3346322 RepID=UPI0036DD51C8
MAWNHTQVPTWRRGLVPPTPLAVYVVLLDRRSLTTGETPEGLSYDEIAADALISARGVARAIRWLRDHGLTEVSKRMTSTGWENVYTPWTDLDRPPAKLTSGQIGTTPHANLARPLAPDWHDRKESPLNENNVRSDADREAVDNSESDGFDLRGERRRYMTQTLREMEDRGLLDDEDVVAVLGLLGSGTLTRDEGSDRMSRWFKANRRSKHGNRHPDITLLLSEAHAWRANHPAEPTPICTHGRIAASGWCTDCGQRPEVA